MIDNKITIKDDEKVNIQRGAIGHRSTWTGLTYKYAVEEGRAEEVEAIIRKAISETGRVRSGNAARSRRAAKAFLIPCLRQLFRNPLR